MTAHAAPAVSVSVSPRESRVSLAVLGVGVTGPEHQSILNAEAIGRATANAAGKPAEAVTRAGKAAARRVAAAILDENDDLGIGVMGAGL